MTWRRSLAACAIGLAFAVAGCVGSGQDNGSAPVDSLAPAAPIARDAQSRDATRDATPDARPAARPAASYDGPQAPQTVVPVVLLDSMGKSIARTDLPGRIRIVEDHDGQRFDLLSLLARPATLDVNMTIRIRGNSTARYAKKSYSVELWDDQRKDSKGRRVLDMPEEADWVLRACYGDKTCLRDAVAYTVGRSLGRWNPRFRFVEVVLNGEYLGLYLLVEKIKLDSQRVPLPPPAADTTGDLSGGYIVKRDGPGDGTASVWTSRLGNTYTLHVPNERKITPAQKAYLVGHFDRWEAAMQAANVRDPINGYRKWIDVGSFADFIIMTELAKGVDSYRRSAYLYKEPDAAGGRLYAGPLWDFDLAFGNAFASQFPSEPVDTTFARPDVLMYEFFRRAAPPHNMALWWYQLLNDPAFTADLKCRMIELRRGPLSLAVLNAQIDAWVKLIGAAEKREHARWPVLGKWIWGEGMVGGTYDEEVEFLRRYLDERLRWLDTNLPGVCR